MESLGDGELAHRIRRTLSVCRQQSDASLPMLAEFVRKDSGRIDRFLTTELSGVLHKEGSQWAPDKVNSQG